MQRICLSLVLGLVLVGTADAQKGGGKTKYTVDVTVSGSGLVTTSTGGISCPSICTSSVNAGTAITFTATADGGATFIGWGDACATSASTVTCSLTVNSNTTVSAFFESGGGGGGPTIEELQARIEALEASLAGVEELLASLSYSPSDAKTGKPTLYVTGVNLQVVSGSGSTQGTVNGTGNLIIGYNEADTNDFWTDTPDLRSGSHNLIVGQRHSYSNYGGILGGANNTTSGPNASVVGGGGNRATADSSAILGGNANDVSGVVAVIAGGERNTASGVWAAVLGGKSNAASGNYAAVSGGQTNTASGIYSSIAGGRANAATFSHGSVLGGYQNTVSGSYESVAGGDSVTCSDDTIGTTAVVCGEGALSSPD